MELHPRRQRELAARAETLAERVRNDHVGRPDPDDEVEEVVERLLSPTQTVDGTVVTAYPSFDEGDEAALARYVAFDTWPENEQLPGWVTRLDEILRSAGPDHERGIVSRVLDGRRTVPFEDALTHFLSFAVEALEASDPDGYARLAQEARESLVRWLLERLSHLAAPALYVDFRAFTSNVGDSNHDDGQSARLYSRWVDEALAGRWKHIVSRYPLLGRFASAVVAQWTTAVEEFCRRLDEDYGTLADRFSEGDLGDVSTIEPGVSDRHRNGRTVFVVGFSSGREVVYKPRSVDPEAAVYETLRYLDDRLSVGLKSPAVLRRDGYGWVEKVERAPLPPETGPAIYYRRAGVLLFVAYLLDMSDIHFENVVAAGDHPVLVDCETVMSREVPLRLLPDEQIGKRTRTYVARNSVFKTGMVPYRTEGTEGWEGTLSAIASVDPIPGGGQTLTWVNPNTDAMDFEYEPDELVPKDNYPKTQEGPVYPRDHVEDIVDGFSDAYSTVMNADHERGLPESLFERLDGIDSRFIFRASSSYEDLREAITTPECLRNGVEFSSRTTKLVELLSGLPSEARSLLWPIVEHERVALGRLDIPRFTTVADHRAVAFDDEPLVLDLFERSGVERVEEIGRSLSESDLRDQCSFIRCALDRTGDQPPGRGHRW